MPWCKFFIPKIASPHIKPGDANLNEHIMYAKCVKGHVLKDANDWLFCENLPAPDARCWQEGGETVFTLTIQRHNEVEEDAAAGGQDEKSTRNTAPAQSSKA